MKRPPLFSVVIPTRGRPRLLADAIASVLWQSFADVELIVSDNCNVDDATSDTIALFAQDPRMRVLRTATVLAMHEHWEFATRQATGQYVLVLPNRAVLAQNALSTLRDVLVRRPELEVCCWRWSTFDEVRHFRSGDVRGNSVMDGDRLSSVGVLEDFVRRPQRVHYELPRGLNSLYRSDLAGRIRQQHGALFLPLTPDYTSAFLLLASVDEIVYLGTPLVLFQGESLSGGGNAVKCSATASAMLQASGIRDPYDEVPIKAPMVENLIVRDFLACRRIAKGNLADASIDWVEYFVACYLEIQAKIGGRVAEKGEIARLSEAWAEALLSFDEETQRAVKARIRRWRVFAVRARAAMRRSVIGPVLIRLKRFVEAIGPPRQRRRFDSALEAAGFDDTALEADGVHGGSSSKVSPIVKPAGVESAGASGWAGPREE